MIFRRNKPIIFNEFKRTAVFKELKHVGDSISGIPDGQPYIDDNILLINKNRKRYQITNAEYFDTHGFMMPRIGMEVITTDLITGVICYPDGTALFRQYNLNEQFYYFMTGNKFESETNEKALTRRMYFDAGIDITGCKTSFLAKTRSYGTGTNSAYAVFVPDRLRSIFKIGKDSYSGVVYLNKQQIIDNDLLYPVEFVNALLKVL